MLIAFYQFNILVCWLNDINLFAGLQGRWPCMNNCGRSYKNKGDLIRHIRKECGIPPQYRCDTCRKMFKHVHHLKSHMIVVHQKLLKAINS